MVSIAAALPRGGSGSGAIASLSAALPGVAKDAREDGWGAIGVLLGGTFCYPLCYQDGWLIQACTAALARNETIPKDVVATLVKEMGSVKLPVRRAVCAAVGSALWDLSTPTKPQPNGESEEKAVPTSNGMTPAATDFLAALTPAFEANLKTVSSTPLNLPAGPLEGYVAAAIGFARGGKDGIGEPT